MGETDAGSTPLAADGPNVERLKMIQSIVERLAGESASAKRWSVATTAAILILASKSDKPWEVLGVAGALVLIYGLIDAYYLGAERAYRMLYETASHQKADVWDLRAPLLEIPLGKTAQTPDDGSPTRNRPVPRRGQAWRRFFRTIVRGLGPTVLFHLALIALLVGLALLLACRVISLKG